MQDLKFTTAEDYMDDSEYTTEVVATVRFTIRHLEKMDKQTFLKDVVPLVLDYDMMYTDGDTPCLNGWSVISEKIENANKEMQDA